jgi:glutamyl-tRNA reductase
MFPQDIRKYFERYSGITALEHLFGLMGKIGSRVLGETYVPMQIKHTFSVAQEKKAINKVKPFFEAAMRVNARACSETKIEGCAPVDKIAGILEEFLNAKIVLFGAGLTGQKVVKHLSRYGHEIMVVNRDFESSKAIAEEVGGRALEYSKLSAILSDADMVICATLASHPRITPQILRPKKPLIVVDLSPFANVDPSVKDLSGVVLINGWLRKVIDENMKLEKDEVPKVKKIIKEEIEILCTKVGK